MAYTSLTNIIEPKLFAKYVAEAITAKSALIRSGAVITSNEMNALCAGAGRVAELPHFGEQAWSAPDVAKADDTVSTVNNVTSGSQITQKDFLSKTWGSAALTAAVSGADVVGHIVSKVSDYWVQTYQQYALSKLSGVIKDNVANDAGDMVKNLATDASTAITAGELVNVASIVEAVQTMGDARDKISLIVMHSRVYSNLLKSEPTNFAPPSATVPFTTYMGYAVIIDDSLPAVAGTNRTTYTTYLLGAGALAMGESEPDMGALAVVANHDNGNGFGAEKVISRKQMILHPVGFASNATVTSGFGSPALAAYDAASAWNRVYSRKNVPIVALKTNG